MADVTPGIKTSEFIITSISMGLSVLATIIPTVITMFTNLQTSFPQWSWIGPIIGALGMINAVVTAITYQKSRTNIKIAAMKEDK
jgi:hypothetical protein